MARLNKIGLDYFPLDTNIGGDDKIKLIEAEFGIKGFAVIIKLYCKIYSDKGYYYSWTEVEKLLFAKATDLNVSLVDEIVKRSIKWGLFDESVFNKFHILTSPAIQKRFLEATSRRQQVELIKEYCIIDVDDYINKINVNINSINVNINSQSKVDKIKERKNNNTTKKDIKERVIIQKKKFFEEKIGSEKDWEDYTKLMGWMKNNTPTVLKMRDILTAKEFVKLKSNFSSRQIATMLIKMDNYKPLLKKNFSTYRTFLNWMDKESGNQYKGTINDATKRLKELLNENRTK